MDEDERDYDQASFERALIKLVNDPRAHAVDMIEALAPQLCIKVAADDDVAFVAARKEVLWIIEGLLLSIEPAWPEHEKIAAVMAKIDAAIWPAPAGRAIGVAN
jgi:hypothetical protein